MVALPHWIGTMLRVSDSGNLYDSLDRKDKVAELRDGDVVFVLDFDLHPLRGTYYQILTQYGIGWTHAAWLRTIK